MKDIPTYVYAIFILLMYIGIKRCFARTIRVEKLWIMPVVFLFLSLRGMFGLFHITIFDCVLWIFGIGCGLLLSYFHVRAKNISADRINKLISIPGDCSMLLLLILIFAFEFFIHYSIEAGLAFTQLDAFKYCSMLILGLIAGLPIGRNLIYTMKYIKAI